MESWIAPRREDVIEADNHVDKLCQIREPNYRSWRGWCFLGTCQQGWEHIYYYILKGEHLKRACFVLILLCSKPNISASNWPNFKIKDSFEIYMTSAIQNCPYFYILTNQKLRYLGSVHTKIKTKWALFLMTTLYYNCNELECGIIMLGMSVNRN